MRSRFVLPAVVVAGALLLGACSSGDHSGMDGMDGMDQTDMSAMENMGDMAGMSQSETSISIPVGAAFNATDVAFAQGMIPHHAQAVEMSDLALANSSNPEVLALATEIKAAQSPEIAQMTAWLTEWGQSVPDPAADMDMNMSGSGGMMMSGMMSESDMSALSAASGTVFDRMFLEMMVRHHEGAVQMAEEELANGRYQPTLDLATAIVASQTAEILRMQALLASL